MERGMKPILLSVERHETRLESRISLRELGDLPIALFARGIEFLDASVHVADDALALGDHRFQVLDVAGLPIDRG
ncbi:MAG TPA: hypothetical protein VGT81_22125, partial [Casimicrobiaceae bacterium]|nr:hypothetical protein [Casimicrobiaceae bacterium]